MAANFRDPAFWGMLSDTFGRMAWAPVQPNMNVGEPMQQYQQKQQEAQQKNATLEWLKANDPEAYQYAQAGAPVTDALKFAMDKRREAQKPKEYPSSVQEYQYAKENGFDGSYTDFKQIGQRPLVTINDEMGQRERAAAQFGLKPDDPAYKSFVLTGKLPREDQAPLTATDKKAILEADEMVQANSAAIDALQQAKKVSENANSGWLAGTRATLGNNLPDWMVPDAVSSPDSSAATTELDNLVTGTALAQLKTIFGGAPTEGERKILLDIQGASSQPAAVRQAIYDRAIAAAQKRLEFNRRRAEELRGETYYKNAPAVADPGLEPVAPATSTGIKWSIEGQ